MGFDTILNKGNLTQSIWSTLIFTYTETFKYDYELSVTLGVETTIVTGIPFLAEGKVLLSFIL